MFTEKAKKNLKAMLWQAKISAVDNTDAQAMRVPSLYADWEALESAGKRDASDQRAARQL